MVNKKTILNLLKSFLTPKRSETLSIGFFRFSTKTCYFHKPLNPWWPFEPRRSSRPPSHIIIREDGATATELDARQAMPLEDFPLPCSQLRNMLDVVGLGTE